MCCRFACDLIKVIFARESPLSQHKSRDDATNDPHLTAFEVEGEDDEEEA
jgi:hypothetical protein